MNAIRLALLSSLIIVLTACLSPSGSAVAGLKGIFMKEQKHSWNTVILAPRHYPVELVAGESFWMYDNGARIGFYTHAGGGWRTAGADAAGGSVIPDGVNLTWLAPLEGKYYHFRVRLPKDKMIEEFNRRLSVDGEDEPNTERFEEIQFALAPGGFVSMRIGWAEVKEIAQFQAKEVDISWEYFAQANHFNPEGLSEEKYLSGFTDELPDDIKEQRANGTIPVDRWKAFNTQKFPWHLATQLDLYGYTEFLINGNMTFVTRPELDLSVHADKKAVPAWYRIYFKKDGKRYRGNIIVTRNNPDKLEQPDGDVEIFETFKQYFASNVMPTALAIDIVDGELVAYLTNGTKKQELPLYDSDYRVLKDDEYPWFK